MPAKPFSQACENNKAVILEVLKRHLIQPGKLLEIGSGTGQHAAFFAEHLPHLLWQTSDLVENHAGILAWMHDYRGENLLPPFEWNVATADWSSLSMDAVFTANTLHIMSWQEVEAMITGVGQVLSTGGVWAVYGPFNYNGQFTSESNARFNDWLYQQAPHRAIRDFEKVCALAEAAGLQLLEDNEMPANNRCLVFRRD